MLLSSRFKFLVHIRQWFISFLFHHPWIYPYLASSPLDMNTQDDIDTARSIFSKHMQWIGKDDNIKLHSIEKRNVPSPSGHDIPITVFTPPQEKQEDENWVMVNAPPLIFYIHGGGWTVGSTQDYDRLLQTLCFTSNCIVMAIDYRKAPEYPYPAALEDVEDVYRYILQTSSIWKFNPQKIYLAGDSAGGKQNSILKKIKTIMFFLYI